MDYFELAREMDFTSIDAYPTWRGDDESDVATAKRYSLQYDLTRGLLHKPFLLKECTPSLVNWHSVNKLKRSGQHMLASMQVVAHGSDSVQYFQFRKSRGSSEKFHGAVVDHVGTQNTRVFGEISEVGARLAGLDEIVGTYPDVKTAILYDWSNRWMLDDAQGFRKNDKKLMPTVERFYESLWDRGINTEIICCDDDLENYKIIVAPMLYAVSEETGRKLESFVKNGGILLCTYMTAMVNENDLCYLGGFPGAGLQKVFGIWNEEIDTLYPEERNTVRTPDGERVEAKDYCELIHAEGAEVLAQYDSDFYKGRPAATVNRYGQGLAYYVAFRDTGAFTDKSVERALADAGVTSDFDGVLPAGVTAHFRTDGAKTYVFLQNFNVTPQTVETAVNWTDFETKEPVTAQIALSPRQTVILVK